jgi:N-dimethylarginine dimethylaminohydrolase
MTKNSTFGTSAYGGDGWSPRTCRHEDEIGTLWAASGQDSEWRRLKAVMLHRPGQELEQSSDPKAVQMLETLDLERAQRQHDDIRKAYEADGVRVYDVAPDGPASANQMFCADLLFATPGGIILARPASTVRAGEERQVARRLADLGIPIVATLSGTATFEGADAMWLDDTTVIIGRGLRTNDEGAGQVSAILERLGISTIIVDMPYGTMHLMGMLRIADANLAIAWPRRTPHAAIMALQERGFEVVFLPDQGEADTNRAMNFVTLGPRKILMVGGNPATQTLYQDCGITCIAVEVDELAKAAGAVGCLTGVVERARQGD